MLRMGILVGLTLALGGCMTEANFRSEMGPRASFELGCPEAQLTMTPFPDASWGVAGCGRRAVYAYYPRLGYVNNTGIAQGSMRAAPEIRSVAPLPVPRAEEFVIVPIRAYVLHARGDASPSFASEIPAAVTELNRIFAVAGVYFSLQGGPETLELPGESPSRRADVKSSLPSAPDHDGFRLFLVRDLDANAGGLGDGDLVVMRQPRMKRVAGGTENLVARASGHVLAAMLGLTASRNESELMAQGTTGIAFDAAGASSVHAAAKLVRGARTLEAASRTGMYPDAVAALRARP